MQKRLPKIGHTDSRGIDACGSVLAKLQGWNSSCLLSPFIHNVIYVLCPETCNQWFIINHMPITLHLTVFFKPLGGVSSISFLLLDCWAPLEGGTCSGAFLPLWVLLSFCLEITDAAVPSGGAVGGCGTGKEESKCHISPFQTVPGSEDPALCSSEVLLGVKLKLDFTVQLLLVTDSSWWSQESWLLIIWACFCFAWFAETAAQRRCRDGLKRSLGVSQTFNENNSGTIPGSYIPPGVKHSSSDSQEDEDEVSHRSLGHIL